MSSENIHVTIFFKIIKQYVTYKADMIKEKSMGCVCSENYK